MRAVLLTCLLLPAVAWADKPMVSPAGLHDLAGSRHAPLVLDVRSPEEFAAGHVPGAINVPHDQVAGRLDELRGKPWVVVYCKSGRRAGMAEDVLSQAGLDVRLMSGSFPAWEASGLPVAKPDTGAGK